MTTDPETRAAALEAKAWPFEEARKLLDRLKKRPKQEVLFETGYGPSGLPHIGTFGEVARTTMVRHAFEALSDVPTRLVSFSDDMDGLRKVPGNVPNQEMMREHLGKPLTSVPDPFGTHSSFGAHNNARLRAFLDRFGFDYEFLSSTECYKSGRFDQTLLFMLERYDDIMAIMLPSLREERAKTYSPFLPLHPETGIVMQVPIDERNASKGTIVWTDPETNKRFETSVTGGACKLQWKADWAMRWLALDVDYEMAGKDLIDSVKLSGQIVRKLGSTPPEGFNFELFLDEHGARISKSKGNESVTVDSWLKYAAQESLQLYMFQSPRAAKRLYFDVIPKAVDEYISFLDAYQTQDMKARLGNPVWHIHGGRPPQESVPISFSMLLNLVSASNSEDREVLWGFIRNYVPGATPSDHAILDGLVTHAIAYYHDFVKPAKKFRPPTDKERAALADLRARLLSHDAANAEELQNIVYAVGKENGFEPLRAWFSAIYEVLLGEAQGPRFGTFIALYGVEETCALIERALAGEFVA
ncbi:MAG: lysine--tRNA ligase [Alphaproteobacteria bacterium]